jgi:MFS transporter, putative metabolite:H+ symporter
MWRTIAMPPTVRAGHPDRPRPRGRDRAARLVARGDFNDDLRRLGRIVFSYLSDAIGRRASGGLLGFGAALMVIVAAYMHDVFVGTASVFWLLMIVTFFFGDGGFAVVGPYAAEVWPADLRTSGMGSAYGFGGIGKIIGPLGLALIVGSSNVVTPQASVAAIIPAFIYLGAWFALAGAVYYFLGIETKGRSIEEIDALVKLQPTELRAATR